MKSSIFNIFVDCLGIDGYLTNLLVEQKTT